MGYDAKLKVEFLQIEKDIGSTMKKISTSDVLLIRLPNLVKNEIKINSENVSSSKLYKICQLTRHLSSISEKTKDIIFLGPLHLLPYIYSSIDVKFQFKELIAIKLVKVNHKTSFLPNEHIGLIIFSYKRESFNEVRAPYEYCKCCKRTVKDYGGKTHLLHDDGTRISDVWKDIPVNVTDIFPEKIVLRIKKLLAPAQKMTAISLMNEEYLKFNFEDFDNVSLSKICPPTPLIKSIKRTVKENILINGDVLESFKKIPDNTVDLALVDPPYNLAIRYGKFNDNMSEEDYLRWCKSWLDQIFRTLKKDGILTLVNIPKWSLELFPYLIQRMNFQGWVVWDAWGYPSKKIIPAHYPILCFTKGATTKTFNYKPHSKPKGTIDSDDIFYPLNYGYCMRKSCKNRRTVKMKNDRRELSDLWTDVHRIRHNSFRYNHPTLMPQKLAKKIIPIFSKPGDLVLDCFNGVGTTTLVAEKLARNYIGIELNHSYYGTSLSRHHLLSIGKDPFEKRRSKSTSKNKWYNLVKHRKYEIPKKALQLEVKNLASRLGHCPSKTELRKYGKHDIKYYYDNFRDWAEITVAVRRTGLKLK